MRMATPIPPSPNSQPMWFLTLVLGIAFPHLGCKGPRCLFRSPRRWRTHRRKGPAFSFDGSGTAAGLKLDGTADGTKLVSGGDPSAAGGADAGRAPGAQAAIFVKVLVADPDAAVPAPVEVELCLSGGQRQGLFRLACLRNKDGVLLAAETAGENHLPASAAAQEPMGSMEGGGIRPGHGRSHPVGRPPIR